MYRYRYLNPSSNVFYQRVIQTSDHFSRILLPTTTSLVTLQLPEMTLLGIGWTFAYQDMVGMCACMFPHVPSI